MSGKQMGVLQGAALTVSMRWTDRLIGITSTLILARLLIPEDFGIVAMSSLVIGLADMLLDLGVEAALIQNRNAAKRHYDSAWTLRLIQMSMSALLVVACAPLAASYFSEPRVVPVLYVAALTLFVGGLENIGTVTFQKEMRFGLDFRFMFMKRFVGFVVTLAIAVLMRNYWALVLGALSARAFGVALSYRLHAMRPRLHFGAMREIFGFSQWMLVRGLANYLDVSLHRFLVGGRESSTTMGGYTVANEIGSMPSSELLLPINRVLFPAFVEAREQPAILRRKYVLSLGVQSLLAIPASVGLLMVAPEAVPVMLGEQWFFVIPFVQILALVELLRGLSNTSFYLMVTLGQVARAAMITVMQVVAFATLAFLAVPHGGADELAMLRLAVVALGFLTSLMVASHYIGGVGLWTLIRAVMRPVGAALAMVLALQQLVIMASPMALWGMLLSKIALGALVFVLVDMLLWFVQGRPDGAERYLLDTFGAPVKKLWRRRTSLHGSASSNADPHQ